MGAKDDFFVNFGSNSPAFLRSLKRDLSEAKTEIASVESALAALAAKSRGVEVFGQTLRDANKVASGRPIVQGGGSGGVDFSGIQDSIDEMGRDFTTMKRQLASVIVDLARSAGLAKDVFQKENARERALEQGFWRNTATGQRAKAGDPGAIYEPGRSARTGGAQPISPALLTQMLNQKAPTVAATGPVRIADVGAVNIDLDAGLDRVVTGLREVRDEVRKLRQKGGAGTGGDKKAKASATPEATAAETEIEKLNRQLAGIQVEQKTLRAIRKQAGDAMSEELGAQLELIQSMESDIRQKLAEAERAESGVSKGERRTANREKASKERGQDLPDVEWDRRNRLSQRLDLALNEDAFRQNVGKKAGQLQKPDLIEMAKQLTSMGFQTRSAQGATVEELTQGVLKGRQAMLSQYGANTPPELALGKRVQTDKLSSSIQELTRKLNLIPQEVQSVQDARDSLRMAGLVGHQPLDPTRRVGAIAGLSQLPPGMVKGGQFDDANLTRHGAAAMGAEEAMKTLDAVWMKRAMRMAKDPDFNLRDIDINKEVKGGGDLATETRKQYYALRRATDNLDDLADEYLVLDRAIERNAAFIDRATQRIGTGAAKPTDAAKIAAARERMAELTEQRTAFKSQYSGLASYYEDPSYQQGLQKRQESRAIEREAAERRRLEALANPPSIRTDVRDALGMGVINSRLAAGTKDTYIRDIAGAGYNRDKDRFDFLEPESRKKGEHSALDQVNKYWTSFNATHNRMAKAVADGMDEEGLAKIAKREENRATKFLNALHDLFGMSQPIENLIGRKATNPKNATADDRRVAETRALHEANLPSGKASTAEEMLATRLEFYAAALDEHAAAEKKAVAQTARTAKIEAKHQQAIQERTDALESAEKAALRAAKADLDAARAERTAIGPTKLSGKPLSQENILKLLQGAERYTDDDVRREGLDSRLSGAYKDSRLRDEHGSDLYEKFQHQPMREAGGNAAPVDAVRRARVFGPQREEEARSAQQAEFDANAQRAREVTAREKDARERITAILGAEAGEVELSRKKTRELNRVKDDAKRAYEAEARNIKNVTVARARGLVESREASLREVERVGGSDEDVALKKGKLDEARTELARLETIRPEALIAALQAKIDTATKEVQGAGPKTTADSAELAAKREIKAAAQELAKELRAAQKDIRAAHKAQDSAALAAAQARQDAIKANPAYLGRDQRSALNKEIFALERAAGGGSGGKGGGGKTTTGGDGSGGPGDKNILRQILAAVNQVNTTLKSGLRLTGGKVTVDPKTGEATVAPRERKAPAEGTVRRAPGEDREMAVARAAQQREAAVLRAEERDAKLEKARERRANRNKQADLDQAHAKVRLEAATALLNKEAQKELAILHQLEKEGATASKVAMQQAKAVSAIERSMAANDPGSTSAQHQVMGREVMGVNKGQYDQMRQSARGVFGGNFANAAKEEGLEARDGLAGALFGDKGFWGRIMGSTGAFIIRNFAAGAVFGLTSALQDIIYQGIVTESTWIRVSDALEQTGRTAGSLRSDLQSISSDYGVALNDVYMTAAGLTGVFEDMGDLASATRVVAQLQAISMGALNAQEAMGVLASITGAYSSELRDGADGLTQVADVLTLVQNVIGTNVETTAEGVGALSGLAQQLKIPFEEMSVYVAQIAKLTNQTGAAAGEQFSRILASMQSGRGRAALSEALPDSGIEQLLGSGEYGQAIQQLMKEWDGLSDTQQRNLSVTIAGQRQARAFAALMNDTGKTLEATARAHNANGEATRRADAIAQTLNGQLTRLQANMQNLAQNLIRTGLLNFFGLFLKVTNLALSSINKIFSVANDIADSNPFLGMIKQWTAGLLGFLVTLKLVQVGFRGLKAAIGQARAGDSVMGAGLNAMAPGEGTRPSLRRSLRDSGPAMYGSLSARSDDLRARAAASAQQRALSQSFIASPAVRALDTDSAARTRRLNLEAGAMRTAASASRGLGKGLNAVAGLGLGAMGAMTGLAIGLSLLTDELGRQKEMARQVTELNERYNQQGQRKTIAEEESEYIGPYSELSKKNAKETKGFWANVKFTLSDSMDQWGQIFSGDNLSGLNRSKAEGGSGTGDERKNAWKGILTDEMAKTLQGLDDATNEAINELDAGRATVATGGDLATALINDPLLQDKIKNAKTYTVKDVERNAAGINSRINSTRADIIRKFEDGKLEEAEAASAMAEIEKLAVKANEKIASQMMVARGMAEVDILSSDMVTQLDALRGTLQGIQGQGMDLSAGGFGPGLDALLRDTGVPGDSKVGEILAKLGKGNLTRVEAMKEDRKILESEYEAIQGRYLAATSGETAMEPEQVDELRQQMIAKFAELGGKTAEIISAAVSTATAIAQAAAGAGDYERGREEIQAALATIAAERAKLGPVSPEVDAQYDTQEMELSAQNANLAAQEKNTRLQMGQARNQSSARDAQLEAQITRNTYQALMQAQRTAQAAGQQGPPADQLRAAKIAWIQAEQSLAAIAQQTNIAAMTLAAAGLWNGIASSQAQEGIAMQQYQDAVKNFGVGSLEALQAQTAVVGAQKSTQSTMDQVAQATNDAALAAIPQGNGVAVAQMGVRNAQTALAAAKKYGTNSVEYQGALAQLYSAQQQVNSATAAVASAQVGVAIAIADAAGNTVQSAILQLRAARITMSTALKSSGGAMSAEVLQARAGVISANAAVRDAKLQDNLDTIDFNLEMGKITQSSAITALREILKTKDLTEAQRRDLMLQIKGMQEELSGSPWNFGDIKLPKPYLMKRYIEEMKEGNTRRVDGMLKDMSSQNLHPNKGQQGPMQYNDHRVIELQVNGGNLAEVRRVVEEVVGKPARTRTVAPRRGRR